MSESDDPLLRRPIIIIGAPRSGTSVLQRILGAHPALARIDEPRITWRWGNEQKSDLLRAEDARPEVVRHIRGKFAQHVREQGATRLVEKTPSNALRPAFVDQVFPDCRFVNILRDGRDAVLSIRAAWEQRSVGVTGYRPNRWRTRFRELELRNAPYYVLEFLRRAAPGLFPTSAGRSVWGPRLPGIQGMLRDLSVLEVSCLQWRTCVEISCAYGRQLPADRYLEFRLEDFSRDWLHKVLEFCEVDHHPEIEAQFEKDFDPTRSQVHHLDADPEELETIRRWTEPTLRWLGYTG